MTVWSWRVDGRFRFKEWDDDDTVVYDVASGDTHVVDPLSMEILQLLGHCLLRSTDSLVADLRQVFDGEPDAAIAARIERSLHGLQDIGLVTGRPL